MSFDLHLLKWYVPDIKEPAEIEDRLDFFSSFFCNGGVNGLLHSRFSEGRRQYDSCFAAM